MKRKVLFLGLMVGIATSLSASTTINSCNSHINTITIQSDDWDELLDEYEEYILKCIKVMEKVKKGDISAMTELASIQESALSLSKKLEEAQKSKGLSTSQAKRFIKLQTKLTKALTNLM